MIMKLFFSDYSIKISDIAMNSYSDVSVGTKKAIASPLDAKKLEVFYICASGSRLSTTRGKHPVQAVDKQNIHVITAGNPTYWPLDLLLIPDVIDLYLCKNIGINFQISENDDLSSDHDALLLTYS